MGKSLLILAACFLVKAVGACEPSAPRTMSRMVLRAPMSPICTPCHPTPIADTGPNLYTPWTRQLHRTPTWPCSTLLRREICTLAGEWKRYGRPQRTGLHHPAAAGGCILLSPRAACMAAGRALPVAGHWRPSAPVTHTPAQYAPGVGQYTPLGAVPVWAGYAPHGLDPRVLVLRCEIPSRLCLNARARRAPQLRRTGGGTDAVLP